MSEWRLLADCAAFLSGGTPSKSNPSFWRGDIPWASAKDLKSFYLTDTEDHISQDGAARGSKVVGPGATLILIRGMTLLRDVPIGITTRATAFNQDVKALIASDGVHPRFLAYALVSRRDELLRLVELAGHGTGRLPTDRLRTLNLWMPSLPEQERVAEVLQALDDKIDLNRRMNQTLEAQAQALFKPWFVDFDPVLANAPGFPTELISLSERDIPNGWSVRAVGDVVDVRGGSTPSTSNPAFWTDGQFNWTTPKDLSGLEAHVLLSSERKITELGLSRISSGLLPPGTVLLSSRAPIGYVAITAAATAINQGFIAMECNGPVSNYYMLGWTLAHMDQIKARANGSTFLEISKSNFRPMPILVPSRDVMKEFDRLVGPLYARVESNLRQTLTLRELRDLLLPKLLSGELRVRDAEREVAAIA